MKIKVLAKVQQASPDMTEFRKYGPVLVFDDLYVEVTVDGVKDKEGKVIVSPQALASALTDVAAAQHKAHLAGLTQLKGK